MARRDPKQHIEPAVSDAETDPLTTAPRQLAGRDPSRESPTATRLGSHARSGGVHRPASDRNTRATSPRHFRLLAAASMWGWWRLMSGASVVASRAASCVGGRWQRAGADDQPGGHDDRSDSPFHGVVVPSPSRACPSHALSQADSTPTSARHRAGRPHRPRCLHHVRGRPGRRLVGIGSIG